MIHERVARLLARLPTEPQYPTQGATIFVDLERGQSARAYTPRAVVETFLEGRGANMFYLYNLLDPALEPLDPRVPMQLSAGLLTGIVPSAARGQVTGVSPETRVLMDSSCGDYVPSFMKLQGIDRLVLYGRAPCWRYLYLHGGEIEQRDASEWVGLDNIDLRARVAAQLGGRWGRDLAMANITRAGENGVLMAGIMGGPKALWARGGTGAKMGSLRLKAIVLQGIEPKRGRGAEPKQVKSTNRTMARALLATGVVKHALSVRGTPFLYKPSRLIAAMGALNNQRTSWTEALDAEHSDPYRPRMAGCFRCPVNCRPCNDLGEGGPCAELSEVAGTDEAGQADDRDRYRAGDGPEYVTLGKLGPMIGIERIEQVIVLNNIANDLGLDTASLGSSLAWAMELFDRGVIDRDTTGGIDVRWGDYATVERLVRMIPQREGFGDVLADSAAAVDTGKYPAEALDYRMAVKGLMQSDPHDARIIKAFALGLAVATRGMDHLRNRATLEINARINDDPAYKAELYGGPVSAEPTSYAGKELAVRTCEDQFATGDATGMCRFTTKLFNSPNLPGYQALSEQIGHVTGLDLGPEDLRRAGRNICGLERMINHRLGVRREHDTLPKRWFEEAITEGPFAGEKIDRAAFDALLDRFYRLTGLDEQGQPELDWRAQLLAAVTGFALQLRLPPSLAAGGHQIVLIGEPLATVGELLELLVAGRSELAEPIEQGALAVVLNDEVLLSGRSSRAVKSGDRVELVPAMAGG